MCSLHFYQRDIQMHLTRARVSITYFNKLYCKEYGMDDGIMYTISRIQTLNVKLDSNF